MIDLPLLTRAVRSRFALGKRSDHGPAHWARVLNNGLRLAKHTGADIEIVRLFALLHDACRQNEYTDPDHGRRAAELAGELNGKAFALDAKRMRVLTAALTWHSAGKIKANATVMTCWDADRLDLTRLGLRVDPRLLCTDAARKLVDITVACCNV